MNTPDALKIKHKAERDERVHDPAQQPADDDLDHKFGIVPHVPERGEKEGLKEIHSRDAPHPPIADAMGPSLSPLAGEGRGEGLPRRHAEIGGDDFGARADLVRRAVGDLAAVIEHDDAVGDVHHDAHIVLDQCDRRAELVVDVEDEAAHVLLLLDIHARHRLVEQQELRLHRQCAAELDALLQPVGQPPDRRLADRLDFEKVDDPLDLRAMRELLLLGRAEMDRLPQKIAAHLQEPPGHDVVERRHPLEQRDVLKGAGDALRRGVIGTHPPAGLALPGDGAGLRVVEAVDDVEHRGLAGAVRPDHRQDLVAPDLEADRVERGDAAKGEGNAVGRQDRLADLFHPQLALLQGNRFGGRQARVHVADRQLGAHLALAAVLEGDLGRDAARRIAGIERFHQRLVSVGDDPPAHLAGAGQFAVIGVELLVQDQEPADL